MNKPTVRGREPEPNPKPGPDPAQGSLLSSTSHYNSQDVFSLQQPITELHVLFVSDDLYENKV